MCEAIWRVLFFICAVTLTSTIAQDCKENGTILAMKKPIYDFSVRFLHRISYGINDHFVYSPLATWLQLVSLADGAQKGTRNEMWNIAGLRGYRKRTCYRRKLKEILNSMEENTTVPLKRSSVIIIDKLFIVKKLFQRKVESLRNFKILSVYFNDGENSSIKANNVINEAVNDLNKSLGVINPDDFEQNVLVTADLTYFKSAWKYPFNEAQTQLAPFNSGKKTFGAVDMMNQVGYFKEAVIPQIGARVLELPFADDRTSMLVFLPTKDIYSVADIFYLLKDTSLTAVLHNLKMEDPKAVNVSLPRFTIETEVSNVPELLYDMGVKRVFYPELAELGGITDSGVINVSSMKQISLIEVTESHVTASAVAESLISDLPSDFNANKPFGFMLVDKKIEIILFAGMYSNPIQNNDTNDL